jgi:alpha-D-xyloside xylohydrolase
MKCATCVDGKLLLTYGHEKVVIEGWGRDGLRVRATVAPRIDDTPWALVEPVESDPTVDITDALARIRNGRIEARVADTSFQDGWIRFFSVAQQNATPTPLLSEFNYRGPAHNPGTRVFDPVGGDLYRIEAHFAPQEGERLYGLGQNAFGHLDLKGSTIDLFQRHTKAVIPFVVSSLGYGFLWNNPGMGRVELGTNRTRWVANGTRQIDYYIVAGETYEDVLSRYVDATGHAPMLPYWATGFWQSKNRYRSQEELLDVAREYHRRGLPLSVIALDYLHWRHTGDWKLDPDFWPDPEAMVGELADMGVRIMVSPWILVSSQSENFEEMNRCGFFVTADRGLDTVSFTATSELSLMHHYDATNPEAARFLWKKWKTNYFDLGIRTFWLDPCDTVVPLEDYDNIRYHLGTGTQVNCFFPYAHQKAIFEALHESGEHDVVTICRSAWAGSQKYGAALWSGDIESSFEVLSDHVRAGLNVAMSGLPWWTTDIGGYFGGKADDPVFRELIVRWYQYGVFCPLFRTHGKERPNEAWSFGEEAYRHIRAAMMLRERLRPYVMDQMRVAHERGIPPMRPLFFDFQNDPGSQFVEDQFLFGPDILVAPITEYGARERAVYLPPGPTWTNAWTEVAEEGGSSLRSVPAPLEQIPVYVRESRSDLLSFFRGLYDL